MLVLLRFVVLLDCFFFLMVAQMNVLYGSTSTRLFDMYVMFQTFVLCTFSVLPSHDGHDCA